MTWHYQPYHKSKDCYFCQTDTVGHHYKTRNLIKYANVLTVSRPTPKENTGEPTANGPADPCSEFPIEKNEDSSYVPNRAVVKERHFISSQDYSDLSRDLNLSYRETEILGSRIKQWNVVDDDFKVTFTRNLDLSSFEEVFKADDIDNKLVYCVDVDGLFAAFDHVYCAKDWRLFLDGSCKSLKVVLIHNENQLPTVPIAYATDMKETYQTMEKILRLINYNKHQWQIVSDLKVLTILLGMQGGYTKHPCYF
ncbi:uncharacterized protein LOC118751619 [Rhagoletis pomonella]|uniref:uncharacterized protein LOC118751619 n=1 Tax=Rhagoletis pomonella TaxID=28610 RepID=UPI0017861D01|nr:uncharacterized protein LOC118751619 [Rhagoletis pomonella]